MHCPRCGPRAVLGGGRCGSCAGRLLADDTLTELLARVGATPADLDEAAQASQEGGAVNCPVCDGSMQTFEFRNERIDHCGRCPTVWADAREVEALLGERVVSDARERAQEHWTKVADKRLHLLNVIPYEPPPQTPSTLRVPQVVAPAVVGVASAVVGAALLGPLGLMAGLGAGVVVGAVAGGYFRGRNLHLSPPPPRPLQPDAPILTSTDEGFSLHYRQRETERVPFESGEVLQLWTARAPRSDTFDIWLAVAVRPPVHVVNVRRRTDADVLCAKLERWAQGVLGVEVVRRAAARPQ